MKLGEMPRAEVHGGPDRGRPPARATSPPRPPARPGHQPAPATRRGGWKQLLSETASEPEDAGPEGS